MWITNVVKVRPAGRNPNRAEIDAARDYLGKEIRHVTPTCILALGGIAYKTLTGGHVAIRDARKTVHRLDPRFAYDKAVVLTTWHPIHVTGFGARDVADWKDDLARFKACLEG